MATLKTCFPEAINTVFTQQHLGTKYIWTLHSQTADQWNKELLALIRTKMWCANSSDELKSSAWFDSVHDSDKNEDWSLHSLHAWDINWLIGMRAGTLFISSRFLFFLCCCDTKEDGFLKGLPEKHTELSDKWLEENAHSLSNWDCRQSKNSETLHPVPKK